MNKILTLLIILVSFAAELQASVVKKQHNYKAYYNTSYGRLSFDEILLKKEIQSDEFLSNIFEENNLGFDNLNNLVSLPDSIFNERRIRVGNKYGIVYKLNEEELIPQKFVYEKNKIEYLVASLNNEFKVELNKKPIVEVEREVTGVVNSSLYVSMQNSGINPLLAVDLSEVYAWTIDFYKIQKGDYFKIIYSEQFVEGKSLNYFDIKASVFSHRGTEKPAFYYQGEDEFLGNFYDEEGGNLRQAFLKAPVRYSRISSFFSPKRFHPVQKRWKAHLGTDYAAPRGTPIHATSDGVIIASKYSKYNGNYVKIKHNGVYSTQYLHMSKRAVKKGAYVTQGQVIGYVGSTGLATGPHVCYRFWKNGKQVDPRKVELPKAEPIEAKYLEDYLIKMQPLKERLNNIKPKDNEV